MVEARPDTTGSRSRRTCAIRECYQCDGPYAQISRPRISRIIRRPRARSCATTPLTLALNSNPNIPKSGHGTPAHKKLTRRHVASQSIRPRRIATRIIRVQTGSLSCGDDTRGKTSTPILRTEGHRPSTTPRPLLVREPSSPPRCGSVLGRSSIRARVVTTTKSNNGD